VEVRFQVAYDSAETHSEATHVKGASPNNGVIHPDVAPLLNEGVSVRPVHRPVLSLNPKYTFDTFVVGKSNELAHAAADAVSKKPGTVYNPLVLYSDVGLGKTHLLHAIGHRLLSNGMSLIYATTEQFTNEYIKAIRQGTTDEFRDFYRSADLLLLDDIQFLIGKEQTQEGFFHTFNALHMTNRQIVITSDRPVTSLMLLEDRIQSRLSGGLVADIQPPDLETRLAILRAKAELMSLNLEDSILELIGERTFKNIRELEGALNRVVAYSQLMDSPITPDLVRRVTTDAADSGRSRRVSEEQVLDAVASHFGVDKESIKGRKRDKKTALARQVSMYLLKEESDLGATAIGRVLGGKDHTTVLHGCKTIENQQNVDNNLRRDIIKIRETLAES
jgi:chromosomal replication initiator protein